jgi:hypothetical protein
MGSVAEASLGSTAATNPTALDDTLDHLGAAEDLLRDGDEAGALEHIALAEALVRTREGWQAIDGVRKHNANHCVLIAKAKALLAVRRDRDAAAAADDALRHGEGVDCGEYVAEAQLQRANVLIAAKDFGAAEDALARGIAAAPESPVAIDLRVVAASLKSIKSARFKATTLACRMPMSYSNSKAYHKTDIFLNEIPLGDRRIFIGGPSLVSKEGFMRRKHNPTWCVRNSIVRRRPSTTEWAAPPSAANSRASNRSPTNRSSPSNSQASSPGK